MATSKFDFSVACRLPSRRPSLGQLQRGGELRYSIFSTASAVVLFAALLLQMPSGIAASASDEVQSEVAIITAARNSARLGDDPSVDLRLAAEAGFAGKEAPGVLLARRAAGVCGWLCNDNERGRAIKIAERVVRLLADMHEDSDSDRVERFYWEAWLEGEILNHKARALALLQEAEKLAPNDPRILDDELRWAQALGEFAK